MAALTALNLTAAQLLGSGALLQNVLLYHVSAAVYPTVASLVAAKTITTATNATLSVSDGTAGTTIAAFGSNATIVRGGFAGVIQPSGAAVSACWHWLCVCAAHSRWVIVRWSIVCLSSCR